MVLDWEVWRKKRGRFLLPFTLILCDLHRYDCYNYWKCGFIYECGILLFITPFQFRRMWHNVIPSKYLVPRRKAYQFLFLALILNKEKKTQSKFRENYCLISSFYFPWYDSAYLVKFMCIISSFASCNITFIFLIF